MLHIKHIILSTAPEGDKLYKTCVNFKALSLMSSLGATTDFGGDLFLAGSPLMTWGPLSRVKEANEALQNQNNQFITSLGTIFFQYFKSRHTFLCDTRTSAFRDESRL